MKNVTARLELTPDKRKAVGLVEQARDGRICIPNFQREFIWTRDEVADLVRSILRGYFIGSLLFLRTDPLRPPFAPAFLRGAAPSLVKPHPELLILDGQQRLSALLYALTAPDLTLKDSSKRRWFFVDLNLLLEDPESDEIVLDYSKRELGGLDSLAVQYERRILPCTRLLSHQSFTQWLFGFEDWMRATSPQLESQYRNEWRGSWDSAVSAFQSFDVPLVELPAVDENDSASIGRVCAIFEKLNSTGVDLSVYDLLTARLYRSDIRLHDLWTESCVKHPRLRAWSRGKADHNKFGVLVLRTLALLRGLDPKPRILIDLKPKGFEEDWRRAAAAMDRALELVTHVGNDGFGVFEEKWLPGFGLIPVVAALRCEIDDRRLGDSARADLRRWYWCNVFMERYSSAIESKSRKDYSEMMRYWLEGGSEPALFAEARTAIGSPGYRISTSASYASAVYSGVFCLLARRHAQDWRLKESIELQKLEDHHIFPRAYLTRKGLTKKTEINTIVNRTLLSNETNQLIKDRAPAFYVVDPKIFPHGPVETLMQPHFVIETAVNEMRVAEENLDPQAAVAIYSNFLAIREASIIEEIRLVCGIAKPAASAMPEEILDDLAADALASDDGFGVDDIEDEALEAV